MTKNSNHGRTDILCPFGCRQNNCKTKSNKRSKRYYQKQKNREKKRQLNRARSLINYPKRKPSHQRVDYFTLYLKFILQSILLTKLQTQEIIDLQDKVRSRGLSFYQKLVHDSGYG